MDLRLALDLAADPMPDSGIVSGVGPSDDKRCHCDLYPEGQSCDSCDELYQHGLHREYRGDEDDDLPLHADPWTADQLAYVVWRQRDDMEAGVPVDDEGAADDEA